MTDDRPLPPVGPREPTFTPLHVIAALIGALAIWLAAGPVNDFDAYWHVELGREILRRHAVHDLPSWWIADGVSVPSGWATSQWLSEVLMHLAVAGGGWKALIAVRVLVMTGFVLGLAAVLLRHRHPTVGVPIFVLTLATTSGGVQDRPQTAALLFLLWLGHAGVRLWATGHRPPLWLIATASLLWAQLHGTWILAPAAFLLIALGLQLDAGRRPAPGPRRALLCVGAALTGVINPHGPASFLLPLRFSTATHGHISEWWPTTFAAGFTLAWAGLLLLTFAAWARSSRPVPRVELLWVIGWTVMGLQSFRNVSPAVLLTAPAAALALQRLREEQRWTWLDSAPGRRESRLLAGAGALILTAATGLALATIPATDPFADTPGRRIAAWVADRPGPVRVFNNWNASGALIGLSDGKARLIIDGRADLWGAAYAERVQDAESLQPGTLSTVTDFAPDAVVTERSAGLVTGLTAAGWHIEIADGNLVLVLP